jgi:hypothetical protein
MILFQAPQIPKKYAIIPNMINIGRISGLEIDIINSIIYISILGKENAIIKKMINPNP